MDLPSWNHRKFFGSRKKDNKDAEKCKFGANNQVEAMISESDNEPEKRRQIHKREQAKVAYAPPMTSA